ncbi:hypothetical protein CH370_18785 [Leptospira kmetyi]|uniref:helix-turn-helix domain-containing protein n=1 Tax=Leptospira kmetyi TaxID=408139 RepID=UPI000C299401|nr:helix-turn-helix transcriptional regulator [Leptospira kmetyi]PJZ39971.1 hypothetical protein CH370_18785 [Leptospira kmetyi]
MEFVKFKSLVANKIKEIRLKKKITQEGAAGLKIGVRTYQRIESGETSPNIESIFIIARNLGVHPKEIFDVNLEEKIKAQPNKER